MAVLRIEPVKRTAQPGSRPYGPGSMEREQQIIMVASEALDEILNFCGQALSERDNTEEGSPEWQKRTGEILAYGKMTSALDRLEDALPGGASQLSATG